MFELNYYGQIGDNYCKKVHILTISIISQICYNSIKTIKAQFNKISHKFGLNYYIP